MRLLEPLDPSRPIEAPLNKPKVVKIIFPTKILIDNIFVRSISFSIPSAAIVCGIPVPSVPRNNLTRSNVMIVKPIAGKRR